MNIYFTASTMPNMKNMPRYRRILSLLNKKHTVISGKQAISKAQLQSDTKLGPENIFEREKRRIEKADCVVAEVADPSTGVGGKIVYALLSEKPVLALFYGEAEDKLSPMIAGNPSENLYLEHYNNNNLAIVIQNFLAHVEVRLSRKGKLIVIDGGDGSGKTTQAKLLIKRMNRNNIPVVYMDFPRYYSSFHGKLVGRYLSGEFGGINEVSPYLASLAYALDRASAREEMEEYLNQGKTIISNRYVTSSMAHQAAKLPEKEKLKFISWIDELEYRKHKMPRPDIVVYLYVPWKIGLELTREKAQGRKYNKGNGMDIAEADIKHRKEAEKMYLKLSQQHKKWTKVNCIDKKGKIFSKKEIHEKIVELLKDMVQVKL